MRARVVFFVGCVLAMFLLPGAARAEDAAAQISCGMVLAGLLLLALLERLKPRLSDAAVKRAIDHVE
jgi:hypothetical protein